MTSTQAVTYTVEPRLDPAEFVDVLERSGLAARRPVEEAERVRKMVENADLVVCAREGSGRLVGVARSVTDFSFCCYLSDLAVDAAFQERGIGRELIQRTQEAAGTDARVVLLSAPGIEEFYSKAGLERLDNCFAGARR